MCIRDRLERYCKIMVDEIDDLATDYKIPHTINSIASMFQIFFTNQKVIDYKTSKKSSTKKFHRLFTNLLKNGIFTAPSQYETVFLSDAHTDQNITKALGNGFTISAVGGKKEIMNRLSPDGKVYQASTYAGNPLSVAAAISSIKTINKIKNKLYPKLELSLIHI